MYQFSDHLGPMRRNTSNPTSLQNGHRQANAKEHPALLKTSELEGLMGQESEGELQATVDEEVQEVAES